MRYRINHRTGTHISEIGIGTANLAGAGMAEGVKALRSALEGGINYYDLAAGDGGVFPIFGEAFHADRRKVNYQIHFGADYSKGTYGWTLNRDEVQRSIEWQLRTLRTDYIDFGFIHCQDEGSDWESYRKNGVLDYLLSMKEQGVVKHIGLSSHTPSVINTILDTGLVDMLMFSINPGYDYNHGDYANGSIGERHQVYLRCRDEGVGISVMKPFSGGQLLDAKRSPFRVALTDFQCMRYALDTPGVLTILPGIRSCADVERLLKYENATEEETDYSVIRTITPEDSAGKCVYCNHCKPCPAGLDIGLINKYYDLALLGDALAVEHYRTLEKTAADCVSCGHCDRRCPFHVNQSARMKEIDAFMRRQ
ncbi:MAG: aldo/keto reductase [Clostridia bacterium]|nr:aldo/keto reductase [Clostridia bacterium]